MKMKKKNNSEKKLDVKTVNQARGQKEEKYCQLKQQY